MNAHASRGQQGFSRRLIFWTNLILPLVVGALALIWYHDISYMTSTAADYLQTTFAWLVALTGAVTWFSGIAWGVQYTYNRLRQRPEPQKLTRDQWLEKYLPTIVDGIFRPAIHSPWLTIGLIVCAALFTYGAFWADPPFLQPGGPIVVTPTVLKVPYTRNHKHVYVVVKHTKTQTGGLSISDDQAVELKDEFIPLESRFTTAEPSCVAIAPSKGKVFVTDPIASRLYVIDETWRPEPFAVGWKPMCVAVSPDERKVYVTNEQPAPYGTISVFDIDKGVISHTIRNVNCPEDIAVSRDGRRLYVTTQCAGGHDPLLVIDTATDAVVATIPDVEIGHAPAVSPDGKRVFVSRINTNRPEMKKFLLSVFSTTDHKELDQTSFDASVNAIAVSASQRHLFVAVGPSVKILNAKNVREEQNEIQTCKDEERASGECWPVGLALSEEGALYILKRNGGIMFFGITGLLDEGKP